MLNLFVVEGLSCVFHGCRVWPHKFHVSRRAKGKLLGLLWTQLVKGLLILGVIFLLDRAVGELVHVLVIIVFIPDVWCQRICWPKSFISVLLSVRVSPCALTGQLVPVLLFSHLKSLTAVVI
jgi:hypothetical protein